MATENEIAAFSVDERGQQITGQSRRESNEPTVTVRRVRELNAAFEVPDRVDLRKLYFIVVGAYPILEPRRRTHDQAFDNFVRAFYRIGHLGRADKFTTHYDLMGWSQEATDWLRAQGHHSPERILPADFVCAVVAHGDVDYLRLDRYPHDCSAFGLNRGRWGRPATDAWRRLLETGQVRPPTGPVERRPVPQPRIVQLNYLDAAYPGRYDPP